MSMIIIISIVFIKLFLVKTFILITNSNYVLEMSHGVEQFNRFNWKIATSLFFCWLLVFLFLAKGVHSLGK